MTLKVLSFVRVRVNTNPWKNWVPFQVASTVSPSSTFSTSSLVMENWNRPGDPFRWISHVAPSRTDGIKYSSVFL